MNKAITNKPDWRLALIAPLCIFLACFIITRSSKFALNQELLSNAILIDLTIIAPLAWFVIIRKSSISKLTVGRVFIAGLLIAGWLLKGQSGTLLQIVKTWVFPLIEGVVIILTGRKFYSANKKARQSGTNDADFLTWCRLVVCQVIGSEKAGNIVASEIGVLYYAFIGRTDKTIDYKSKFTSYKENGIVLVLGTFLSLFLIETIGMHFVLSLWNHTVAWVLTVLSFYTCLQLYAHIKAIKARPLNLSDDSLKIYNGLAADALIKYSNIEKFELSGKMPFAREAIKMALIKGLENHNCIIYLRQPIHVTKIFGIKKWTNTVLFFVDRPKDFAIALNFKLVNT